MDNLIYAVAEELVVVSQTADKDQMRHILEGVLAHFFTVHRSSYDDDDVMLFLKIANRQTRWLATYGMDEVIEVSHSCKRVQVFNIRLHFRLNSLMTCLK